MAMQPNLIGLWHFDEPDGAAAFNGAPDGGALYLHHGRRLPRRLGHALQLAEVDAYARGAAPQRLAEGTLSCWLQPPRAGAANLLDLHGALQIMVDYAQQGQLLVVCGQAVLASGRALEPDRWIHVAVTFTFEAVRLFLDGRLIAEQKKEKAPLPSPNLRQDCLLIGPLTDPTAGFALDELALFNRALDEQEIVQLVLGGLEAPLLKPAALLPRTVDARAYLNDDDATAGLQRALDELGPAGGCVLLPPGVHHLRAGLHLRTGVTLDGQGQCVLRLPRSHGARLRLNARLGADSIEVEDAALFQVGDEVCVLDNQRRGWNATFVHIRDIDDHTLWLTGHLLGDYLLKEDARVMPWFAAVSAVRHHHLHLRNLTILGQEPAGPGDGSHTEPLAAALRLIDCREVLLENCIIRHSRHEGVSVLGGCDVTLRDCTGEHLQGHGLCVGQGARAVRVLQCRLRHNRGDGMRLEGDGSDHLLQGNEVRGNGRHGIAFGPGGEGQDNLFLNNHCIDNARCGIEIAGGIGGSVADNVCRDNSRRAAGRWPGILLTGARGYIVRGNLCASEATPPTQAQGVLVRADSSSNLLQQNLCRNCTIQMEGQNPVSDSAAAAPSPVAAGGAAAPAAPSRQRPLSRLRRFPDLDKF